MMAKVQFRHNLPCLLASLTVASLSHSAEVPDPDWWVGLGLLTLEGRMAVRGLPARITESTASGP